MKSVKNITIAFLMLFLLSCNELIDEVPQGFINDKTIFDTEAGAQAALLGCYEGISTYYYFGVAYTQLLSLGSGAFWTNHTASLPIAQQTAQPSDALVNNVWRTSYTAINAANVVIENIQKSSIRDAVKNRVYGEALFIRAMLYFNNVRIWGAVPLRLTPASSSDLHFERTPVEKIYDQIIKDLEAAKINLPDPQNQVIGYPHKWAAYTLLAKVYLTMAGNDPNSPYWQKSIDEAIQVYNSGAYTLVRPFKDLWDVKKGNSKESIFEIQYSMAGGSSNGLTQIHMPSNTIYLPNQATAPTRRIRAHKVTFDDFRNQYPGDPRINATFLYGDIPTRDGGVLRVYPNNTTSEGYPYIFKYCDPAWVASVSNNNFIYLRYADVLLMLAEAENEVRGPGGAYKYINELMARARDANGNGLTDANEVSPSDWSGMTKEEFRQRIMLERRIELLGETHEFFDTRRRGTEYLKSYFEHHNSHPLFNASRDFLFPTDNSSLIRLLLFPLPSNEINANELIKPTDQNPGY